MMNPSVTYTCRIWLGIYKFNFTNDDIYIEHNGVSMKYNDFKELEKHCKSMPDMTWCESFAPSQTWNHFMNHADIVSDELSFISEMIPHHQEAVDTSSILLTKTQNSQLKIILQAIISWQNQEIVVMKKRLSDFYSGSTYQTTYMPMMRDVSTISAITTLEGVYIEDMILHHQGAIDMATKLLHIMEQQDPLIKLTAEAHEHREIIKKFAQDIVTTQSEEIIQFQELLKNY